LRQGIPGKLHRRQPVHPREEVVMIRVRIGDRVIATVPEASEGPAGSFSSTA
jgi:hypothetical protein